MTNLISASILSADFGHLAKDCEDAVAAGADMIHFDVMDHHFVPNLSFGAVVCDSLRKSGLTAPIDVHLMVENPDAYIEPFAKAGANLVTFHPTTTPDVGATIAAIKAAGMQVGLAFNPDEPVSVGDDLLKQLDMILIMTVFPGFGGQSFMPECLEKISLLAGRVARLGHELLISVDGGIKKETIGLAAGAGANCFVVGSGLFNTPDYTDTIQQLRQSSQA
ncbi:MAG: ribulose-phosphate 3-epimerase [Coxiellaceae bacterium]|nr:ribulose-phosphate 3-epimerase [Coxiellaceae bacterium]